MRILCKFPVLSHYTLFWLSHSYNDFGSLSLFLRVYTKTKFLLSSLVLEKSDFRPLLIRRFSILKKSKWAHLKANVLTMHMKEKKKVSYFALQDPALSHDNDYCGIWAVILCRVS